MLTKLSDSPKVVGLKQSLRAIRDGKAAAVYLADDAADKVRQPVILLCRENNLTVIPVISMAELGAACDIDIAAAVATVLKP
jgi:large subunit ribosomal protein L7A